MTSPTYCAPCIADLALVREAVTSVAGTASCMAHAVLLTHSTDDPGRRRQRLDALKDLAGGKAETAEPTEQVKLELLVQEYGLAGAMDMGQPARRGQQQQPPRQGVPSAPGEGRKSRRGRTRPGDRPAGEGGEHSRGDQPRGERPPRGERRPGAGAPAGAQADGSAGGAATERVGETAPVTPAPGPAGEQVSVPDQVAGVEQSSAPEQGSGQAPQASTASAQDSAPDQAPQSSSAGEPAPQSSSTPEQAPPSSSSPEQPRQPASEQPAAEQPSQQPSEQSSAQEQSAPTGAPSSAPPSAPDA